MISSPQELLSHTNKGSACQYQSVHFKANREIKSKEQGQVIQTPCLLLNPKQLPPPTPPLLLLLKPTNTPTHTHTNTFPHFVWNSVSGCPFWLQPTVRLKGPPLYPSSPPLPCKETEGVKTANAGEDIVQTPPPALHLTLLCVSM